MNPRYLTLDYRKKFISEFSNLDSWTIEEVLKKYKKRVQLFGSTPSNQAAIEKKNLAKIFQRYKKITIHSLRRLLGFTLEKGKGHISREHFEVLCLVMEIKKPEKIVQSTYIPLIPGKIQNSENVNVNTSGSIPAVHYQTSSLIYQEILKEATDPNAQNYEFEDALIKVIHKLNQPSLTECTIVVDNLDFVFHIAPSLVKFLNKPCAKLYLLLAPKLLLPAVWKTEFLFLLNLNVRVDFIPPDEPVPHYGFYFNYDAQHASNSLSPKVEFCKLRNNLFTDGPVLEELGFASENENRLRRCILLLEEVRKKRKGFDFLTGKWALKKFYSFHLPSTKETSLRFDYERDIIDTDKYCEWLGARFSSMRNFYEETPIYSTFTKSQNIHFKYEAVDVEDIYFRQKSVCAFKVYQAEQVFLGNPMFSMNQEGIFSFIPFNLFENHELEYYPMNVPFLERNNFSNRYEIAAGASRIYAVLKNFGVKKIQTVVVHNLPKKAFDRISRDSSSNGDILINNWLELSIEKRLLQHSIMTAKRCIDGGATHSISKENYKSLEELMISNSLSTEEEIKTFRKSPKYLYL